MKRTAFLTATVLLSLLTVVGCAAAATPSPTLNIDGLLAKTSAFQRALIQDGVVTPSEYEKALLTERECVAHAGATPGEIHGIGNNEQGFDWEIVAPTQDEADAIQERADKCDPEYFSEVGTVWAFQQLLTPAQRSKLQPEVVACLRKAGLSVPGDADLKKITEIVYADAESQDAAQACIERYVSFFSVPPAQSGTESE